MDEVEGAKYFMKDSRSMKGAASANKRRNAREVQRRAEQQ
jgi:hypothetical protein